MKHNTPSLTSLVRKFSLIGLIGTCSLSLVQAAPPPSSFGVWDRADYFDSKEYPFLKGSVFNKSWADIEKKPGGFDWSGLDQTIEKACQNKMYLYLSLGLGPQAPEWIYEQGVPKVFTDDTRHLNKWKCYPYYLSPAYKIPRAASKKQCLINKQTAPSSPFTPSITVAFVKWTWTGRKSEILSVTTIGVEA